MTGKRVAVAMATALLFAPAACGDAGESSPQAVGSWELLPEAPLSPREGALGLWTGTEALIIGGSDARPCPPGADCEVPRVPPLADGAAVDPATAEWRRIATAPTAVVGAEGVVLDGTAYVWVQGDPRRPGHERAFLAYRIDADRWERLPPPPGVGDQRHSLVATDAEVVLFRDSDEHGESPDLAFDPGTERWRELPADPLLSSFDRALAWSGEELVLIAKDRGRLDDPDPLFVSAAAFDLERESWRQLPDSEVLDMGLTGCWVGVDGRIVNPSVGSNDAGGRWDRPYPDGGVLDPATGKWSDLPERPTAGEAARYAGGILTGSEARCMGTDGWVLDAPAGRWVRMPEFPRPAGEGITVVGTVEGAFAFGGAQWHDDGGDGRLTREAWLWSPR